MCGRAACNHCREVYQKATCYYDEKRGEYVQPEWNHVSNCNMDFKPSCNIAPTDITPIIISGEYATKVNSDRILQPMMWGLIPPWHKGSYKSHGLSTNNCRIENIGSSKLYSPLMKEGKRCIMLCDGFYEWQTTGKTKTKQPYFIYSSQDPKIEVDDEMSWSEGEWNSLTGWHGARPLYMAALFSVWQAPQGGEIYNYTVITRESKENFSWLHHRVPAVLSTEKQIHDWLDFKTVNMYEALKLLENVEGNQLAWHPVSTLVNKTSNKSSQCIKKIQIKKATLLTSWLKKSSPVKREAECPEGSSTSHLSDQVKKFKEDDSTS